MRAQLVHLSGPLRAKTGTHAGTRRIVGAAAEADVCLESSRVAPRHAEITWNEHAVRCRRRPPFERLHRRSAVAGGSDGTAIGVNRAILPGCGGANSGVPIRCARELLEP